MGPRLLITILLLLSVSYGKANPKKQEGNNEQKEFTVKQTQKSRAATLFFNVSHINDTVESEEYDESGEYNESWENDESLKFEGTGKYIVTQQENLYKDINGIDGYLQTLQDDRITPQIEKEYTYEPNLNCLKVLIRIVDKNNKIIWQKNTVFHIAQMNKVYLYGDNKPTFLLTFNNSAGMGRDTGHLTYFLEVVRGKLKKVVDKEGLQKSIGSDWKIIDYKDDKCKQILYIDSRNLERLLYKRYYFNGKKWKYKIKSEDYQWWEDDLGFPELNMFP